MKLLAFLTGGAFAACMLAPLALPAHAGTVTQDLDFSLGPLTGFAGPGTLVASDWRTGWFQQFDPAQGVLTAARWELQSAWAAFGSANVESHFSDPSEPALGILGLQVGMDTRVNFSGGLAGTGGQYFSHGQQASQACVTNLSLGPCVVQFEFGGTFDAVLAATELSDLIGTGSFEQGVEAALAVTATADLGVFIDAAGQLLWTDRVDRGGSGRLRLVYEFDEAPAGSVPEPSSLALALAGLALAAWPLRRRHARRQAGRRWRLAPLLFGSLCGSAALAAEEGIVDIDQTRALAGGITPGDNPGWPVLISKSGHYRLTSDLVVGAPQAGRAVVIHADNVTLDLNGFTIQGPNTCHRSSAGVFYCTAVVNLGFGVESRVANSVVRNGRIIGMGDRAVAFYSSAGGVVENVHVSHNAGGGIVVGSGSVRDSSARLNGGSGFILEGNASVHNSRSDSNRFDGFALFGPGVLAVGLVATANGGCGVRAERGAVGLGGSVLAGNVQRQVCGNQAVFELSANLR